MSNKVLTISVAAYNSEAFLAKNLERYNIGLDDSLEVIIVNDGSSDATLAIAKSFEEKNSQLYKVIDKENGGHGSTFNAALKVARGKYIRFIDSDDWADKDALISLVELLQTIDTDVVYAPFVHRYEDNPEKRELVDTLEDMPSGEYAVNTVIESRFLASHTLIYQTKFLRDADFKMTEHCFYVDTEYMILPFAYASSIYVTHFPLYQYLLGREGQSVGVAGFEKHWQDLLKVDTRILEECALLSERFPTSAQHLVIAFSNPYWALTSIKPSSEKKAGLVEYDKKLSKTVFYKEILNFSKRAKILSVTGFMAYYPLSLISLLFNK